MSMAPRLRILPPIRAAIAAHLEITSHLAPFNDDYSLFTRRPVPVGAGYPMMVIGPTISLGNQDGINDFRPVVVIDINVYGTRGEPNTKSDEVRLVADLAEQVFRVFHRQRNAITVENYSVIDIVARGPTSAPVDDDARVGRRITLTIRLYAKGV